MQLTIEICVKNLFDESILDELSFYKWSHPIFFE